jgi:site-specific recombinase XerD
MSEVTRAWNPTRPDLVMHDSDRELIKEFRRHLLARGLAIGTVRARVDDISNLAHNYGRLEAVKLENFEEFLARRRRSHRPESRKSIRSSWKVFYSWMVRTHRMEMLAPVQVPQVVGRIVSDAKVMEALQLSTLPEKAMILLGRAAGLRLSEIATLHSDMREGDMLLITGKGEKQRMVPINSELLDVLERLELIQGEGYYFPGRWGGSVHPQSLNKIITRRLGANPHSLRHAAATAAYRGTGDLQAVQQLLGHASLATTQRYLHIDPNQIRAAAAATSLGLGSSSSSAIERVPFSGGRP